MPGRPYKARAHRLAVYKQFTYARNIIQYNINDLLDFSKGGNSGNYDGFRYRDPLTEGYSVTPNFFVRGEVTPFLKAKCPLWPSAKKFHCISSFSLIFFVVTRPSFFIPSKREMMLPFPLFSWPNASP